MAKEPDPKLRELIYIRKLLILSLLKDGLTQSQVAGALDLDRSAVSRMFAKGTLTGIGKKEKSIE